MSARFLTEAPEVAAIDGEVMILAPPASSLTPEAARQTAAALLRAADEVEREQQASPV